MSLKSKITHICVRGSSERLACNSAVTSPYCYFTPCCVGVGRTEIAGRRFLSRTYTHSNTRHWWNNRTVHQLASLTRLHVGCVALESLIRLKISQQRQHESLDPVWKSLSRKPLTPRLKTWSVCRLRSSAAVVQRPRRRAASRTGARMLRSLASTRQP